MATLIGERHSQAIWRDYLELTKPKVVVLMLITSLVGMFLATRAGVPWTVLLFGNLGIALCAGGAAVVNHVVDRRIDALMARTHKRPLAKGGCRRCGADLCPGAGDARDGVAAGLHQSADGLADPGLAARLCGALHRFLKRATPQNIVIGGLAGAAPPLLGWVAVTGHVSAEPLLLVLIIFAWTPPHFWALAIHRKEEYAKADIPMLPVTHGEHYTKVHILLYTFALLAVSLMPYVIHMSGLLYLACALDWALRFLQWAWCCTVALGRTRRSTPSSTLSATCSCCSSPCSLTTTYC
jgi:protoheme IX farnesyltransferase